MEKANYLNLFTVSSKIPPPKGETFSKGNIIGWSMKGASMSQTMNDSDLELSFPQRYLLGLTRVLYYAGFLPFRLTLLGVGSTPWEDKTDPQSKVKVERKQNILQKAICFLIHLILFCSTCAMTYDNLYREPIASGRPLNFLQVSVFILGPTITLYYFYTVWFRAQCFEWLLVEPFTSNANAGTGGRSYSLFEKVQNLLTIIVPITSIMTNLVSKLLGGRQVFHLRVASFQFLGELQHPAEALVALVAAYSFFIIFHMGGIIYTVVILTFRDMAREFIHTLGEAEVAGASQENDQGQQGQVFRKTSFITGKFLELEANVNALNERFGGWIFAFVIFFIPFYSMKLVNFLKWEEPALNNFLSVVYTFTIFFWLISSALVSNQICDHMRSYLVRNDNYSKLTWQEMSIISPKLTPDGITVRGGNYFAISYSLIGTIVSLVMTWAFIDQKSN